ncbi:hypothetical protein VTN77DRAFT_4586 [Rasamsonia byssochlamydoides]|uniref:uncharacterized protein n=1 Tax=Rasamsonia byssochlamydoides TaxID=89139 RepID=UPI003741F074
MSDSPTASGRPPSGPRNEEQQQPSQLRSGIEHPASTAAPQASSSAAPSFWETGARRPFSWHQPPLIEPRPEPTQPRSIGVHAILNPPEGSASNAPSRRSSREVLEIPPSVSPSPQQRSSSSPLMHASNQSGQYIQADRPSLSPGLRPRRIITPVSPAARFANIPGKPGAIPGKVSVSQSPFVQEPSSGVYSVPPSVSLPPETTQSPNLTVTARIPPPPPPPQPSRHSTPILHSRQGSAGFVTNPSSQDTSPSTPHSAYSQFPHSSPSIGPGMFQPQGPPSLEPQPFFHIIDPISRAPSQMGGLRYGEDSSMPGPLDVPPGKIPVVIDLKSGSRSQAEKRKANSDASRRFRSRKKNEMVLEKKINALEEEIRLLTEERDYYRTERDFFRESLSRTMGSGPLPTRPPSPRHFRPSLGQAGSEASTGSVVQGSSGSAGGTPATSAAGASHPLPTAPPHPHMPPSGPSPAVSGSSTDPSAYLTATAGGGQRVGRDEGQLQPLPPPPGPWAPSTASGDVSGGSVQPTQGTYRAPPDPQQPRDSFGRSWNPGP